MDVMDMINKSVWTPDCGGKWDLDFSVLECETRYWSDCTAKPCFICSIRDENGVQQDYYTILEPEGYIEGESEEECKLKVRQWYKDNVISALNILVSIFKEEQNEKV